MIERVNIVCLKHGNVYDWTWVDKLYNGVKRSFTVPFNFYVFTDAVDPSIKYSQIRLPYIEGLEGYKKNSGAWWYKLYLFAKDNNLKGTVIYFDLDVILTGNCDFLTQIPKDKFGIPKEWRKEYSGSRQMYNSSVMVFSGGEYDFLWKLYLQRRLHAQPRLHGDQNFISIHLRFDTIHELDRDKVVSWRYNVYNGGVKSYGISKLSDSRNRIKCLEHITYNTPGVHNLPHEARVVVFNGYRYKPNLVENVGWIEEFWA